MKKYKILFSATFIAFAFSSLGVLAIAFLSLIPKNFENIATYILGAMIWIGFIVGICLIKSTDSIKYKSAKHVFGVSVYRNQKFPGVINITLKPLNIILYSIFVIGLALIIGDVIFHYLNNYLFFITMAIIYYLFMLHCIIDGRNYKIYKLLKGGKKYE